MQEMQKVQVPPWVGKIPLEKEMATPSSILAWELPWTEVPGGLQSRGLQRVGHDWATVHTQLISNVLLSGVQSDSVAKWFSYKYTCIYSFSNSCQKNFFLEEVRHDFYQCLFKLGFNFTSDALKILNSQSSYNNQLLKLIYLLLRVYFTFGNYEASFHPLENGYDFVISHTTSMVSKTLRSEKLCETFGKCSKT